MKKLFLLIVIIFALTIATTSYVLAADDTPDDLVEPPPVDYTPGKTCENEGNAVCDEAGKNCENNDPIGYSCVDREEDEETPTPTPTPESSTVCTGENNQVCKDFRGELDCSLFSGYTCFVYRDSQDKCGCEKRDTSGRLAEINTVCFTYTRTDIGTPYLGDTPYQEDWYKDDADRDTFSIKPGSTYTINLRDVSEENIKYTVRRCDNEFPIPSDKNTCPIVKVRYGTEVPVSCELKNDRPTPQEISVKFEQTEGHACQGTLRQAPRACTTNPADGRLEANWDISNIQGEDNCNVFIRVGDTDYPVSSSCKSNGMQTLSSLTAADGINFTIQAGGPYQLFLSNGIDDETSLDSCYNEMVAETTLACSATEPTATTRPGQPTNTPTPGSGRPTNTPTPTPTAGPLPAAIEKYNVDGKNRCFDSEDLNQEYILIKDNQGTTVSLCARGDFTCDGQITEDDLKALRIFLQSDQAKSYLCNKEEEEESLPTATLRPPLPTATKVPFRP